MQYTPEINKQRIKGSFTSFLNHTAKEYPTLKSALSDFFIARPKFNTPEVLDTLKDAAFLKKLDNYVKRHASKLNQIFSAH